MPIKKMLWISGECFKLRTYLDPCKKLFFSLRAKIIKETSPLLVHEILGLAQLNELEVKIIFNQLNVDGEIKDTSKMQTFGQESLFFLGLACHADL